MIYDLTADQQLRVQAASMAVAYGTKNGNPDVVPMARAVYEFLAEQTDEPTSGKHERSRSAMDEILDGLGEFAKDWRKMWDQPSGRSSKSTY